MRSTPLENKVKDIVSPIVADLGLDLVCVNIIGEGGSRNVQIMAEDPETRRLGIDKCTELTKAISAIMDVEDPINGAYRLEVSSPGIDRPLVKKQDFETYKDLEAKIETMVPAENGQKRFRGRILGLENDDILLATDQGDVVIAFDNVAKAKLVMTDELLKRTAG